MDASHKNILLSERSQTQKIYVEQFNLVEVQKKAKLTYGVRSCSGGYPWRRRYY